MCSQQQSLLHWMDNSLISKNYFPQCLFCSKIIHLQKSYLLIRCYKIGFFLLNTNNTDRNGVNKQNTHTTLRERQHWKVLVSIKISYTPLFKTTLPILPTPPFLWKKPEPPLFSKMSKTQTTPPSLPLPFIKRGSSNYACKYKINQPHSKPEVYWTLALATQNKYTLKFAVIFKGFHLKDNQFQNTQSQRLWKG